MLDLKLVLEQPEDVKKALARRGPGYASSLDRILELGAARRKAITGAEAARAERNAASKSGAKLDKNGEEFQTLRVAMRELGTKIEALEAEEKAITGDLEGLMRGLANLPHESAPDGDGAEANRVVSHSGPKPSFSFAPKDHHDLGVGLGIVDFDRAAKISGARFSVLVGMGARLERALLNFMMDVHANEHGYAELWPPALVLESAMFGTAQLPRFVADMFKTERSKAPEEAAGGKAESSDLYLVPTAEVPVTNLHGGEILDGTTLPRAYAAYTPCFRAEAGSYGKDTRGLIRQHQFDKVELVRFVKDGDGLAELELLRGHAERILVRLGLHHRTVELSTGDLSPNARKCYDLEVWLPGQNAYREISSCSWFGDFQARRANIRYRDDKADKPRFVHTLNGSGLAIGRTLVAILEQNQQADGSVVVPEALRGYMGGVELMKPGPSALDGKPRS
jgi:seryl-tRNA synthetase